MARIFKIKPNTIFHWRESLKEFVFWKQAQGISEQTLMDYKQHVSLFFKRFPEAGLTTDSLKQALYEHLADKDIKPCTYNNRLVYLRTFFNWCLEQGCIDVNPIKSFKKRKDEGRVVNIDQDVLIRLLELTDKESFSGLRDFALILLTLDTGIRPKEAFSLKLVDFNAPAQEIYILSENAKTRVSRTLPISVQTVKAIRTLIQVRHNDWKDESVPIFCTFEGKALNRHTWGDRLEMYGKKLGVHIRPYDLRHTFALEYIRNGANALTLQRTLGHSDLSMTKRYVALTNDDLKNQHVLSSPVNKLLPNNARVRKVKE